MNRISEKDIVRHKGIFREKISMWEGLAMMLGVGAGILAMPYAIAQSGLLVGIGYIVILGGLLVGITLMLGSITIRTKEDMQLSGLARRYLGPFGGWLMTALFYITSFGALVVYIIGEGEAFQAIFGGESFWWSVSFFILASALVIIGIRTVKVAELVIMLAILCIIFLLVFLSAPHIEITNVVHLNKSKLLLPFGVVLFALGATSSVPEAHTLLKGKKIMFKKVIFGAAISSIIINILFVISVVGVTGSETTEVATVGLGRALGPAVALLGNLFAIFAMGTAFLMIGLSLKDSMTWDYKMPRWGAALVTCAVPFIIFALGFRQFVAMVDLVGGVFVSLQMLLIILIYWKAKQRGDLPVGKYRLHHMSLVIALLLLVLAGGAIYSVVILF